MSEGKLYHILRLLGSSFALEETSDDTATIAIKNGESETAIVVNANELQKLATMMSDVSYRYQERIEAAMEQEIREEGGTGNGTGNG